MEVLGKVPVSADFVNKNIQPHPLVEHFSYWAVRWSPLSPFPLMCLDMVNLSPPDWSSCCSRSSEIITWPDKFPTINIPLDEMKNVQRRNTRIICKFLFHHIPLLLVSQWTPLLSRNYSPYHQNPFAHRHHRTTQFFGGWAGCWHCIWFAVLVLVTIQRSWKVNAFASEIITLWVVLVLWSLLLQVGEEWPTFHFISIQCK